MFNGGWWLPVRDFADLLGGDGARKTVVSLACSTGMTTFGRTLSRALPARNSSPHRGGARSVGVTLRQALLHTHLLHGHEFMTAARLANEVTEGFAVRALARRQEALAVQDSRSSGAWAAHCHRQIRTLTNALERSRPAPIRLPWVRLQVVSEAQPGWWRAAAEYAKRRLMDIDGHPEAIGGRV